MSSDSLEQTLFSATKDTSVVGLYAFFTGSLLDAVFPSLNSNNDEKTLMLFLDVILHILAIIIAFTILTKMYCINRTGLLIFFLIITITQEKLMKKINKLKSKIFNIRENFESPQTNFVGFQATKDLKIQKEEDEEDEEEEEEEEQEEMPEEPKEYLENSLDAGFGDTGGATSLSNLKF